MKTSLLLCCCLVFASCASVDVSRQVRPASGTGPQESAAAAVQTVPAAPPPVAILYIPEKDRPAPKTPARDVVDSAVAAVIKPESWSHSAIVFDYNADSVYEVFCQPLRATDMALKAGERAVEAPFISDSERWMLGAGVSYENGAEIQHIYIKPTEANLEASLIVNTSERVYHLILRSFTARHMPKVRWRYRENAMPQNYIKGAVPAAAGKDAGEDASTAFADPRFLSFNYRITYALFHRPRWLPTLAFDDGKKTYITFPEETLQAELPAVFSGRSDVINYRVLKNVIVIDRLVEKLTVRIGKDSVTVLKKKGA